MKILSLLLFLLSVRTCTKESATVIQKAAQVEPTQTTAISIESLDNDTVIMTVLGIYIDDLKTRGLQSEEKTRLTSITPFPPEFNDRFTYPEIALRNGVEGKCTIQFAVDAESKIHYFSVLNTDSKLFSDDIRRAISSKPVTFDPFPSLPASHQIVRVELQFDYKLKAMSKM